MRFSIKIKRLLKISASLITSLMLVSFFSPKIFLAGTPEINPVFIASFQQSPLSIAQYLAFGESAPTAVLFSDYIETAKVPTTKEPEGLAYAQIAKGVYAAENPEGEGRIIKVEKGTELERKTIVLSDGREIQVYIPVSP